MPVEFLNKFGIIDLTLIDPNAVSDLTPEQQQALSILIDSVKAKEAAQERKSAAVKRVHAAMGAENAALEAHIAANPPPSPIEALRAAQRAYDQSHGIERDSEPEKKKSHPKHAKLAPRLAYEKAQAETADARLELQAATTHLRRCELIEGDALAQWITITRPPTYDSVNRERLAKEQAAKLERVEHGLPAVEPKKITARSPIDLAAAQRPRPSPQMATPPLRSAVSRRSV